MSNQLDIMKKEVSYTVVDEEVRLTGNMVKAYIARGDKQLSNAEAVMFMNLCKYRKLNPFTNEAYPVKFGDKPAQFIVGKEAFTRRAESNPKYKGHAAGIIVMREKKIEELEGSFKLQSDTLLGGWAEVFVEGKECSIVAKVSLQEYSKGQSTWKNMPCTMIRKVALVQALREAFPSDLGSMYTADEVGVDESKINNVEVELGDEREEENSQELEFNPEENDTKNIDEKKVEIIEAEIVEQDPLADEPDF